MLERRRFPSYFCGNNTRQGYARKCTLKLAGYSFYGAAVTKKPFVKPALSIEQQVDLLRTRGMEIGDDARASFYLQHLNYYRIGAYWLPFEADHEQHRFQPGTTFDRVLDLYSFDRRLRLHILDAIERIEVSLRSVWAYTIAVEHGPHAHLDASIMRNEARWQKFLDLIRKELQRSNEVFIKHLLQTYSEEIPPVWATAEVMSIGTLSRWYENTGPTRTKAKISAVYGLDERVLGSWCNHLTYIRNLCAHHSRVWNRDCTVLPNIPKSKPAHLTHEFVRDSRRIYNTLLILVHMMDVIEPGHTWREQLKLILDGSVLSISHMGFPDDWATRAIWATKHDL